MAEVRLPYFDVFFADKNREEAKLNHNLNTHWGYWEDPSQAFISADSDLRSAAEKLGELVYSVIDIAEGCKLADIGCGFGGTISDINNKFSHIDMVGLNIDHRQIKAAKSRVVSKNNNKIQFITGNACDLPFEDNSIDSLIAVECIFHFSDREKFFSEVARVLKPGGKFAFSDFVPAKKVNAAVNRFFRFIRYFIGRHYGKTSEPPCLAQYDEMALRHNLQNICAKDITSNILPTYWAIYALIELSCRGGISFHKKLPTKLLELSQKSGRVLYMIIGYQKPKN